MEFARLRVHIAAHLKVCVLLRWSSHDCESIARTEHLLWLPGNLVPSITLHTAAFELEFVTTRWDPTFAPVRQNKSVHGLAVGG